VLQQSQEITAGPEFRSTAERIVAAVAAGAVRRDLICRYDGDSGVIALFDNVVGSRAEDKYHTAEEWIFRDDRLVAMLVYVHECQLFEATWQ